MINLLLFVLGSTLTACASAQSAKMGSVAPALTFDHLLQAPKGTKADLASLKGKVVVLEFWATWCVPCIGQIPTLNALQASVNPERVRVISVDDEDPAIVQKFLARTPIAGWLAFDTTGKVMQRYGVESRPATIVVDTRGRVISNSLQNDVRPEDLTAEQLMNAAAGKTVFFAKKTPANGKPQRILKAGD